MKLTSLCTRDFKPAIKQRGAHYAQAGRVILKTINPAAVTARVRGSSLTYNVDFSFSHRDETLCIYASCTCPSFSDGDLCKHIWATLLSFDKIQPAWQQSFRDAEVFWGINENTEKNSKKIILVKSSKTAISGKTKKSTSIKKNHWKNIISPLAKIKDERQLPINFPVSRRIKYKQRHIFYTINIAATKQLGKLVVDLTYQEMLLKGGFGVSKDLKISRSDLKNSQKISQPVDQEIITLLFRSTEDTLDHSLNYNYSYYAYNSYREQSVSTFKIDQIFNAHILPLMLGTNRCFLKMNDDDNGKLGKIPIAYDSNEPWKFKIEMLEKAGDYHICGKLFRGDVNIYLHETILLLASGIIIFVDKIARLSPISEAEFQWLAVLRANPELKVPKEDIDEFIKQMMSMNVKPPLVLPEEIGWRQEVGMPNPKLSINQSKNEIENKLFAKVFFCYGNVDFTLNSAEKSWVDAQKKTIWNRDYNQENIEIQRLISLEKLTFLPKEIANDLDMEVSFPKEILVPLVETLNQAGWIVEASGRKLKSSGVFKAFVSSGTDWFDLKASMSFENNEVDLPDLLTALARKEQFVRLSDGTLGMLPIEWLKKYSSILNLGQRKGENLRFSRSQITMLDILLMDIPEVDADKIFLQMREKILKSEKLTPQLPSPQFKGELRPYQQEGLGWLNFLQDCHFGGCLADDMGLGKTIQVLAMLQAHCRQKTENNLEKKSLPSLIVVPRSLIHNWLDEASRFCPDLKVIDYSDAAREESLKKLSNCDLVLTTYGILRKDIVRLRKISFDFAILDEAQAIKNNSAQVTKAARLLSANNRLALSGTPIENHLGELASIFEFLNPGMLKLTSFANIINKDKNVSEKELQILAKCLRPFILRRTKNQVLHDLPPKVEQTLYCDLEADQRQMYNHLRNHYRLSLQKTIKEKGMQNSKVDVLEALLRLRQASCHVGLIDKKRIKDKSAKLTLLLDHLKELSQSGNKSLVFSQFTSMLAIVRCHLDKEKIPYEYLDGKTRNRKDKVSRFQENASISVFLISLKAGGLGLNLTAADYCFILDPWWNPAIESQAIDRAHRIGQNKKVFAYRLIAKDTVEEKIMEMQKKKKQLADSIVSAENSVLRGMTIEDLELLLS